MSGCEVMPGNIEANQPLEEFYTLTEEQLLSMKDDKARVAWALTRIQGDAEAETLIAGNLTKALSEISQLPLEKVRKANGDLLREGLLDREGFAEPGSTKALQLSLNEKGHEFLGKEVEKAKA